MELGLSYEKFISNFTYKNAIYLIHLSVIVWLRRYQELLKNQYNLSLALTSFILSIIAAVVFTLFAKGKRLAQKMEASK